MIDFSIYAGVAISLALSYFPGVSGWYEKQDSTVKRSILAVAILLIAVVMVLGSCAGIPLNGNEVDCSQAGVMGVVNNVLSALIASQATYVFTPSKE